MSLNKEPPLDLVLRFPIGARVKHNRLKNLRHSEGTVAGYGQVYNYWRLIISHGPGIQDSFWESLDEIEVLP